MGFYINEEIETKLHYKDIMKTYTIYYTQGSKRRITSLLALSQNHAIDKIVSNLRGGTFAETRKPFNMFKAVCDA